MRFAHIVIPVAVAASLISSASWAQDEQRIARMQQTIQELTLQLGDVIRDNAALRRQLDSQGATPQPSPVDCEPQVHNMPVAPHHVPAEPVARLGRVSATSPVTAAPAPAPVQCDVASLEEKLTDYSDPTARASVLNDWVSKFAGGCSREQLLALRKVANSVTLSDDALGLIDYYMTDAR